MYNIINNLKKEDLKNNFIIIFIGTLIYVISFLISYKIFNYTGTILENFAVLTSYVCTLLVVFEKRLNFIFAILSTFAYSILFLESKLFGSAVMNLYFLFISVYGFISWKYKEIDISMNIKTSFVYLIIALIIFILCYYVFTYFDGQMVLLDTMILFLSILANLLMVHKKIFHWYVWIIVNVISIYVYYNSGLYTVAIQYIYFLINAFIGIYVWRITK